MNKSLVLVILLSMSLFANEAWKSSEPEAQNYDWVQLTSGEWVKGEIKGLYDDVLEFDSDVLDMLNIDLGDIKQIKSCDIVTVNLENSSPKSGVIVLKDGKIYLVNQEGEEVLDSSKLISLTAGKDKESSYWSAKISLGYSISSGNTDKIEYNSKLNIKRQTSDSRFKLDNFGNFTTTNSQVTEDNERLSVSFDIFQTRNLFWRPLFSEYYRDTFQNIQAKYTVGAGIGYDILNSSKQDLSVFAGPAYQISNFDSVTLGEDNQVKTAVVIVSADYELEVTKTIDFIFKYQAYFVDEKSGSYTHHSLATLETELVGDFDLDITFVWDYVKDPIASDTSIPFKNDYKSILSVAYSY